MAEQPHADVHVPHHVLGPENVSSFFPEILLKDSLLSSFTLSAILRCLKCDLIKKHTTTAQVLRMELLCEWKHIQVSSVTLKARQRHCCMSSPLLVQQPYVLVSSDYIFHGSLCKAVCDCSILHVTDFLCLLERPSWVRVGGTLPHHLFIATVSIVDTSGEPQTPASSCRGSLTP